MSEICKDCGRHIDTGEWDGECPTCEFKPEECDCEECILGYPKYCLNKRSLQVKSEEELKDEDN